MSPAVLDQPGLDLELLRRLDRQSSTEVADGRRPILEPEDSIVQVVSAWPEGARPLLHAPDWTRSAGRLLLRARDELTVLAELRRIAREVAAPNVAIEIEGGLRPSELSARGRAIANTWLAEEVGSLPLLLAARPVSFALLSPYPDDLGATLFALARQSPAFQPNAAWASVLEGPPARDAAALLAEHLVATQTNLLEERRGAERSVGLELEDEALVTHGVFTPRATTRVDPSLGAQMRPEGSLRLAASRSPLLLAEIAKTLLSANRAATVTAVFEAPNAPADVFSARVFACDDDALEHAAHDAVQAAATVIDQLVDSRAVWIDEDAEWGLPIRLLRLTRRASLLEDASSAPAICLVGHRSWDLRRDDPRGATAPLRACRIALCAQNKGQLASNAVSTRPAYREGTRRS